MSGATSEPGSHGMDSSIAARLSLLRRLGSKGGKAKTSLLWISDLSRKYSRSLKLKGRPLNYRPAPAYEMKTRVLPAGRAVARWQWRGTRRGWRDGGQAGQRPPHTAPGPQPCGSVRPQDVAWDGWQWRVWQDFGHGRVGLARRVLAWYL